MIMANVYKEFNVIKEVTLDAYLLAFDKGDDGKADNVGAFPVQEFEAFWQGLYADEIATYKEIQTAVEANANAAANSAAEALATKNAAVEEINSAKTAATDEISSLQTTAVQAVTDAQNTATTAINNIKATIDSTAEVVSTNASNAAASEAKAKEYMESINPDTIVKKSELETEAAPYENPIYVKQADVETLNATDIDCTNLFEKIYPVGSVYMSFVSTNPQTLFGVGTWSQIKDTFLLATGDTYAMADESSEVKTTAIAGEATHTLTESEMPAHTHSFARGVTDNQVTGWVSGTKFNANYGTYSTGSTGGGGAHNNMPPYLPVYMWRRTS